MWNDIGAFAIGLLGLGLTANIFAGRWYRVRRDLKADAELLALMPPGAGQSMLRARLDDQVADYVLARETSPPAWILIAARIGFFTLAVSAPAWIYANVRDLVADERVPNWVAVVGWATLGTMSFGALAIWLAVRGRARFMHSASGVAAANALRTKYVGSAKMQQGYDSSTT